MRQHPEALPEAGGRKIADRVHSAANIVPAHRLGLMDRKAVSPKKAARILPVLRLAKARVARVYNKLRFIRRSLGQECAPALISVDGIALDAKRDVFNRAELL